MKDASQQIKAIIQRQPATQIAGVIMGCLLLITAMVLGGHMIIVDHAAGHGQNEWYFVGGLGLMGGLALFTDPIIKFVIAINPLKRGDKT